MWARIRSRPQSLHFADRLEAGVEAITDLQRLTVSLRGGFQRLHRCLVFQFTGQLDAYSEKQFLDFIQDHRGDLAQPLVLDLSRIDFIDSSGLGALVLLVKECKDGGIDFRVIGNARVVQTIKLVKLEEFLHLQPDLETALGTLAAA